MRFTGFVVYGVLGLSIAAGYRSLLQITPAQNFNPVSISVTSPPYDVIATPITPVAPYSQAAYQCNVTGDTRFPPYATGTFPLTVSVPIGQRVRVIFANGNLNGATITQQGQPGVIVQQGGVFIVQQAGGASPIVQNPGSPVVQPSTPRPPATLVVQQSPTIVQQNPSYPTSPTVPPTQFTPPISPPGQPTTPVNPPNPPTPNNPPTTPAPTPPTTPGPTTRPPTPAPTTPPPGPTPTTSGIPGTPTPTSTSTATPSPTTSTPAPTSTSTSTSTPSPTTSTPAPTTPAPTTGSCNKPQCSALVTVCVQSSIVGACVELLSGTDQACCCCPLSGGKRHLLEESSEVAAKGRNLLQLVPGGPNNGLVEYVGLVKANTVPGFVVPNTQFGVPYVEFTASASSAGQTAVFQGSLLVANVVNGVPLYPFTPNLSLSPQCQVNVNFLTLGSSG